MKVSKLCGIATSKGKQSLGLIRRTVTYKNKQLIAKKNIGKLERIQLRATKIIPELRYLRYEGH